MIGIPEWQPGSTAICPKCCDETTGTDPYLEGWEPVSDKHWKCAKCAKGE